MEMLGTKMTFTLREWRRMKEITQKTMANRLNVHLNTYQNWEKDSGKISVNHALQISKILGISIDDIEFGKEEA